MRPFDLGDEAFFFGREAQTRALREKLKVSRLIAVVGRSGCGKSSLVRAGLVPRLLQERGSEDTPSWRIATFRPQGRPMRELADALLRLKAEMRLGPSDGDNAEMQALRASRMEAMLRRNSLGLVDAARELKLDAAAGLLIIVDQFEELFRFQRVARQRRATRRPPSCACCSQPRAPASRRAGLRRADDALRLPRRLRAFPGLPEAINDGQYLVPRMTRDERRAAIAGPVRGRRRDDQPGGWSQRLLNDVGDDPDQLPILQHALMRTWDDGRRPRAGRACDLSHYEATGGVGDALSRHADEASTKLATRRQRDIAERIFKALTEHGPARPRDPPADAARRDLAIAGAPEDEVTARRRGLPRAGRCFLMPPAGEPLNEKTPLDISHESLMRGWKKMTGEHQGEGWLPEEDRDGKVYRSLVDAAEAFEKDESAVLPRALTRQREVWWKRKEPNAAWAERYGSRFELVSELLRQSARRQRIVRWSAAATAAVLFLTLSGQVGLHFYNQYLDEQQEKEDQKKHESALAAQAERDGKQSREATAWAASRRQEIEALQQQVADLRAQLQARGIQARADETVQQVAVVADARQASATAAITSQVGYMWVGSVQKSNLAQDDQPVPPPQVRKDAQYTVTQNIYLRSGLPDENYVQQPSVGVVAPNSRVQALGVPVSFDRPNGQQYWLNVRVLTSVSLPTVYFQYTAAPKVTTPALALSQKLKAIGYKVPGEERVDTAQGRREVRYFYAADKDEAEKLAQDTTKALADLGLPDKPAVTTRSMLDYSGKKSAPGVLELWLDLTAAKAATK